mgnify:FL=1
MNRTLLLIVADFLLLSLLALANFEESGEVATGERTGEGRTSAGPALTGPDPAMVDLLASALAAEQATQSNVQEELARTRAALRELRAEREQLGETLAAERDRLRAQEEALASREAELRAARQREEAARREARILEEARETAEQRAARLAGEREELERRRRELQAQLEATATDREERSEELVARERELARLEEQLDASRAELERARQEREAAEREKEDLVAERERLARQAEERQRELAVAAANLEDTRERLVTEQAVRERIEERAAELSTGVTRLSTGVTELSSGVTELAETNRSIEESVRELQPVSANEVFVRARERTVEVVFVGSRAAFLGSRDFREVVLTNLVRIGERAYIFLSVEQTPLRNAAEGARIESLSVRLQTRVGRINLGALQRASADPSLLYASLPVAATESLGVEPFSLAPNPLRGGQATLVDLVDDRFGESDFRLEPGRSGFAEIDRRTFSALFGEFSAGPGDLAFSRQGRWIGVVTAPGSLWIGEDPEPESTVPLGPDFIPALLRR